MLKLFGRKKKSRSAKKGRISRFSSEGEGGKEICRRKNVFPPLTLLSGKIRSNKKRGRKDRDPGRGKEGKGNGLSRGKGYPRPWKMGRRKLREKGAERSRIFREGNYGKKTLLII